MKLPVYQPQVTLPSGYHQPQPSRLSLGRSTALAELAEAGVQVVDVFAKAEQKRQMAESQAEAVDLQAQLELAATKLDADLRRTETDPDAYWTSRTEQLDQLQTSFAEQARKPYTAQILAARLPKVIGGIREKAVLHADSLRASAIEARFDRTADNVMALSAVTPWDDDAGQARLWGMIVGSAGDTAEQLAGPPDAAERVPGVADAALPYKGAAWVQENVSKRQRDFVLGIAERHKDDNPDDFLKNSDRYAFLGAPKVQTLRREAQTKLDADAKTRREEMDRFYDQVEKEAEGERQAQLTALDEKARSRALTTEDLRLARIMRVVTKPSEYDHLAALINAPPDQASHPDLRRGVLANVRGMTPTYTESDIRRFMADQARRPGSGLNQEDGFAAIDKLREHGQRAEDKDYQDRGRLYNQAKERGLKRLGLVSPMSSLDRIENKLIAEFVEEFDARVDYAQKDWRNKGRPADEVLREILPRYLEAQKAEAKLGYDAQFKTLDPRIVGAPPDHPGEGTWQQWYDAAVKRTEALKDKDPALYATSRAQLKNLRDARDRVMDNQIRSQGLQRGGAGRAPLDRVPVDVNP